MKTMDTGATPLVYEFGEFQLDAVRRVLRSRTDARPIDLPPRAFDTLLYLVEHAGALVEKHVLMDAVWSNVVVEEGNLTQTIYLLRRALGEQPDEHQFIVTVPKRGYKFVGHVRNVEVLAPGGVEAAAAPITMPPPAVDNARWRLARRAGAWAAAVLLLIAGVAFLAYREHAVPTSIAETDTVATSQPHVPHAPRNSIAVLPFVDLSPEHDQQYFSDGVAEEILNLLAQGPSLQVIARTSSFSFKDRNADIAEIAAKLNVAYVLEGSVRKSGSRLRITAQLVDAANSAHLWSETYDRELQDAFEVQRDIATRVSEALKVTLLREVIARAPSMPRAEAHDRFLRARFFFNRRARGDLERAKDYYEQALRIDPGFAHAWAGLAGVYCAQMGDGEISPQVGDAKRTEAFEQALALDPTLAEAHVRAAEHYWVIGDGRRAREHFGKAYALDPDDLLVLKYYADDLLWEDRFDEALEAMRRSVALDPVSARQRSVLADFLMAAGRYDEARAEKLNELELNPAAKNDIDIKLAWILVLQHRFAEAHEMIERWPEGDDRNQGLALVDHALGQRAEAEAALRRLAAGTDAGTAVRLAEVYAQWDDADEAFRWMETARGRLGPTAWYSKQWRSAWMLRWSAFLRPLHGDSRWNVTSSVRPQEKSAA
jgi:TolB-like protein/DNA-binding winged helix-turn-helix (wHTH) protein/Flp pilus assembly protein TadD